MIIYENLSWQTHSSFPDSDWTGNAKYVIDDNSDIAKKILSCPYSAFEIIEDNNNGVADVNIIKEPSFELSAYNFLLDLDYRLSLKELGVA